MRFLAIFVNLEPESNEESDEQINNLNQLAAHIACHSSYPVFRLMMLNQQILRRCLGIIIKVQLVRKLILGSYDIVFALGGGSLERKRAIVSSISEINEQIVVC